MRVAVFGLGGMGSGLARRLVDGGLQVTTWNRSPGREIEGAEPANSPQEALDAGVDAVLVSLADDAALRAVLLPGGQPLETGGAAVVNTSTVSAATTTELARAYPKEFIAAPVMGAPMAVAGGTATYLLGGPQGLIDRLLPVWEALSDARRVCGEDPASAAVVKIASNAMLLGGVALLAEAVATLQGAGLPDEMVSELLTDNPMVAKGLRNRLVALITDDHTHGWFTTVLGAKDLSLFTDQAEQQGLRTPVAAAARDAMRRGAKDQDVTAVIDVVRAGA